jgi:hypothetical protein
MGVECAVEEVSQGVFVCEVGLPAIEKTCFNI